MLKRWPLYWNRDRGGERAGPGLTRGAFSPGCFRSIFLRHRPPPYTTVTEPERTPAATESKTIETQPKTTRYRKRRSSQGWIAMSQKSHGPSPASQTSLYVLASATYSASVVENVMHFCVLENQDTQPPHTSLTPRKLTPCRPPHLRSQHQQIPASSGPLMYLSGK